MAIRFVDRRATIGRLQASLEGAAALLQGTRTVPASRSGVIVSQLAGATMLADGTFRTSSNRSGIITTSLAGASSIITGTHVAPQSSSILFRANFSSPTQAGFPANCYNFSTRAANNVGGLAGGVSDGQQNWSHTHLPTGGFQGGPALMTTHFAGRQQYDCYLGTPPNNRNWQLGDTIYFRVRFKFSDGFRFATPWRNKFIMHGQSGGSPNGRIITYLNTRVGGLGATLGWQAWIEGTPYQNGTWVPWSLPAHFGLTGPNDWSNFGERFGSLAVHNNISPLATGPVLLCQPTDSAPHRPGAAGRGAAPVNGWYHVQIAVTSGLGTNCRQRIWANNNNALVPTHEDTVYPSTEAGQGVTGWGNGTNIGGYVDQPNPTNQSIIVSAFEIDTAFDPNWYIPG
jgi:hypothetical protein